MQNTNGRKILQTASNIMAETMKIPIKLHGKLESKEIIGFDPL